MRARLLKHMPWLQIPKLYDCDMQALSPCLTTLKSLATLVHFRLTSHCILKQFHTLLILQMFMYHACTFLKVKKIFEIQKGTKYVTIKIIRKTCWWSKTFLPSIDNSQKKSHAKIYEFTCTHMSYKLISVPM